MERARPLQLAGLIGGARARSRPMACTSFGMGSTMRLPPSASRPPHKVPPPYPAPPAPYSQTPLPAALDRSSTNCT